MTKIGSIIGYTMAVIGLILLVHKHYIFSENPVSITIQVLSAGLKIWSRITFGRRSFHMTADSTEGKLVTNGPYRVLRHPIYAAVIYFSLACLIAFPYLLTLLAVALVTGGLFLRMILEEQSLKVTYPEYNEYAKKAKRLIPFIF